MQATTLEIAFRQALERRDTRTRWRLDKVGEVVSEPVLRGQAPWAGATDYDGVAGTGMTC